MRTVGPAAVCLAALAAACGARSGLLDPSASAGPIDAGSAPPSDAGLIGARDDGVDLPAHLDAGTDTGIDAAIDAGAGWRVGIPVEFSEAVDSPISVATTTDGVLVAYAIHEHSERHLVALALDGVARGPSRIVLAIAAADSAGDEPYGPWVSWGPTGGIVAAADELAGCRTVLVDATADPTAAPVSAGLLACGLIAPSADGWSVITGLTAAGRSGDPIGFALLDAAGTFAAGPVNLMEDPEDDAINNPDRIVLPDGHFALSWWDSLGSTGPAFVRDYDPSGAALAPASLIARIGSSPGASSTRLLSTGPGTLVAWTIAGAHPAAFLQPLDSSGVPTGPATAIGVGSGAVLRVGMQTLRGQVLLAWTERVVADVRLRFQLRNADGSVSGASIDAMRLPVIDRPEVIETPDGALLVYVGQPGSDPAERRLFALPLYAP